MAEREMQFVRDTVAESIAAKQSFLALSAELLIEAAADVARHLSGGAKLLAFGNGGSAADAQNLASELVNRMDRDRPGIAAVALTTDGSVLTSIANDYAYDRVFARQVETLGKSGDVAVGISTSGNSKNVVEALASAQAREMLTVGFLGRDGGKCRVHCHYPLVVPVLSTQRIQEVHILLAHIFASLVEDAVHPR